jgi:hypothetical protein
VSEFEALLSLLLAAVVLAALARKVGAPYPAFLALGGALLAEHREVRQTCRRQTSSHLR